MKGETVHVIIRARKSDWSWYHDNTVEVFDKRITVPANGLVDFLVPGSKVIHTAKSLSLEVSSFGLCIAFDIHVPCNPLYSHG